MLGESGVPWQVLRSANYYSLLIHQVNVSFGAVLGLQCLGATRFCDQQEPA